MNYRQWPMFNQVKTQIFRYWGSFSHSFHRSYDYILLLSPARSGSTLLSHILTSNPEIFGMGESKIAFEDEGAFRALTGKNIYFHWRNDLPRDGNEKYVLDKQVHNYLLAPENKDLLNKPSVRTIFLLRDPQPVLHSYMKALKTDEAEALAYFVSRMDYLGQYAEGLDSDQPTFFLTYETLVEDTKPVLRLLRKFLGLENPLHEQYQVTKTTGNFGIGDKSDNIKSGRILKPHKKTAKPLTPHTQAAAWQAYERCAATLRHRCSHVASNLLKNEQTRQPE